MHGRMHNWIEEYIDHKVKRMRGGEREIPQGDKVKWIVVGFVIDCNGMMLGWLWNGPQSP